MGVQRCQDHAELAADNVVVAALDQTDQDLRSIISIIFAMQSNKVMMAQHAIMPMAKEATVLTQS